MPSTQQVEVQQKWEKIPISRSQVEQFCQTYKVPPYLATVLLRRGVTASRDVLYFLERDLHYLHNPFSLHQMSQAVQRSWQAIQRGERAVVLGDGDVDGVSATVLLIEGLRQLGLELQWQNASDAEGLSINRLHWARQQQASLIFTVDCGSSNVAEIAQAREHNIDVIVLDHHLLPDVPPAATALVNPCIPPYPFSRISTAVVVGKFLWAMGFYQHPHYNKSLALVQLTQDHSHQPSLQYSLIKNFIEEERRQLPLTVENVPQARDLLESHHVLWFDQQQQQPICREVFQRLNPLSLQDLAPDFRLLYPQLQQQNLEQLGDSSRTGRYQSKEPLNTLLDIYSLITRKENTLGQQLLTQSLDLMTLSTIADMMPMHNENRLIVHHGLQRLNRNLRPGLRELLLVLGSLSPPFSLEDLSRRLVPVLNAAGRMNQSETTVRLFFASDPKQRRELALEMASLNRKRRQLSQHYWHQILPEAKKSLVDFARKLVVVKHPDIPRGLTGMLASRLSQFFRLPAIVVTAPSAEQLSGSLRSPPEQPAILLLNETADLYNNYGGHPSAGGFRMSAERWPTLFRRYQQLAQQLPPPQDPQWSVDLELASDTLTPALLTSLTQTLEPFGQQNPFPLILGKMFEIHRIEAFGHERKSHLRLSLKFGQHHWTAVYWNAIDRHSGGLHAGDVVDLLYKLDRTDSSQKLRLVVQSLRHHRSPQPITPLPRVPP